ncbi:MAG TPA: hypothetical protein VE988_10940 [Gemmataceae bacterium]|nr:hypothetical protein [Gemmataceae bacterium]
MKLKQAKKHFLKSLEAAGQSLASLRPADGIDLMLRFYLNERADGCVIDEDGDMLLVQWGCYDWGQGEAFEFNITRQFLDANQEEEDDTFQLSLTFKFEPQKALRNLAVGNEWCPTPNDLTSFRSFIDGSAAFKAIAKEKPKEVILEFGNAG